LKPHFPDAYPTKTLLARKEEPMESLPTLRECPPARVIPLPIALYESNGLLFELYDGGQPYQPIVIRWERLQPVIRKDAIETDEKEWSRKILRTDQMKMTDFLNTLRECFHQELAAKTGWGREELKAAFERAISNAVAPRTNIE